MYAHRTMRRLNKPELIERIFLFQVIFFVDVSLLLYCNFIKTKFHQVAIIRMKLAVALAVTSSLLSLTHAQLSLGTKLVRTEEKKKSSFFATATEVDLSDSDSDTEIQLSEDEENRHFMQSCELGFEGIKLTLKQKGNKPDRVILDGSLKGKAMPGRMLAVMGPSGSGKSSLVHALAGRIGESPKLTLEG